MIQKTHILIWLICASFYACGDLGGSSSSDSDAGEAEPNEGEVSEDSIKTKHTYENFAKDIIDAQCAYCHRVPASKGAPNTFRLDSYDDKEGFPGVKSMLDESLKAVESGTMPPVVESNMTKKQRAKLVEWYKGGAPKGGDVAAGGTSGGGTLFIGVSSPGFDGDAPTADIYTINVSLENVSSDTGWTIYYTSAKGEIAGGTVVASGLDIGTTSYDWDMSGMPDGTYYIYIQVLTDSGIKRAASQGSIVKAP